MNAEKMEKIRYIGNKTTNKTEWLQEHDKMVHFCVSRVLQGESKNHGAL